MTPTKEQRAMMAAHLLDIAARTLREGGDSFAWELIGVAYDMRLEGEGAESLYHYGLGCFGAEPADIDAACEAIARGKHPADSLPGRVEEMSRGAVNGHVREFDRGMVRGLKAVLKMLGRKVTP